MPSRGSAEKNCLNGNGPLTKRATISTGIYGKIILSTEKLGTVKLYKAVGTPKPTKII